MTESERETLTATVRSIIQNKSPQRVAHNKTSNSDNVKVQKRCLRAQPPTPLLEALSTPLLQWAGISQAFRITCFTQ